ncbi:hypothetical protein, partial [Bernardetia sp.]|uniref:hypothetical protein n=1 Tax=Bernardetia sp. TaxID=1937974 RepID=UPI0025B8FD45
MIKDITIALFILVTLLSSCKEEKPSTEQLLKEIKEFERNISEQEDPISFWKNLLKQKRYASNRVAKSSINTMIGVGFYRSNLDSAEVYGTKALVLIEDLEGFEREKIVVYNNLGNIANVKGKSFLSSFYYYRIISILEANPSKAVLRLERKVQSYLNSANANINLNLEESAYNLTRVAASYVDSLSKGDYGNYLRFRIYSQLFSSSYNLKKNTDSLSYYLEKQEQFLISPEAKRFHYLQKAYFFDLNNQFDSAKVYYQKCLIIDQNERKDNVTTPINEYVAYCDLLQNSINRGNINEADSLIDKLNEMRQDISLNLPDLTHVDFWEAMMNYHYKFKNFEEYHEATEKVLELIQEIHKEAELQAKEEMHAMYQLEENKKAIKELNQDVEVKENQLQQTQFLLIITTLGILVALAILALFYYRQKNQKLQQEYE